MHVPLTDLSTQYLNIRTDIDQAITRVFDAADFTNSTYVRKFEQAFAAKVNAGQCVAVNNGTSALHACMMALGIGKGDEVILPSHTFIATALAVSMTGATPVFADCDPDFYTMNEDHAISLITRRTKAFLPVHLYGQMAPMEKLLNIPGVVVIEDCAQAHLARYKKEMAGTIGKAGCYSFYPVKNLGAFGEGGAVVTGDTAFASVIRKIRTYGSDDKFTFEIPGHNYRMEEIQGSVLDAKLPYLEKWNDRRRQIADMYEGGLEDIMDIKLPGTAEGNEHVFHLFVIATEKRNQLKDFLKAKNIITGMHYPVPCHLQPVYNQPGHRKENLPVTERIASQVLSLPMSESHTDEQIDYVISNIRKFFNA